MPLRWSARRPSVKPAAEVWWEVIAVELWACCLVGSLHGQVQTRKVAIQRSLEIVHIPLLAIGVIRTGRRVRASNTHLYISSLLGELPLHVGHLQDQQVTRSFQCIRWVGPLVGLDFDLDVVFLRMRDFVSGKKDRGVKQQLTGISGSKPTLTL